MPVEFHDITAVASEIGPRPAGSPAELEAARYASRRLTESGVPNTQIPVTITRNHPGVMPLLLLLAAVAVPLMRLSHPAGLILSIIALLLLVFEAGERPLISSRLPARSSTNVVGLLPAGRSLLAENASEEPIGRVIVSAHLDSGKASWRWQHRIVDFLPQLIAALAVALLAIPALQIAQIVTGNFAFWYVSLVPMVATLIVIAFVVQDEFFGTAVNGAIGSASGMAVALDVAQQLAAVRLSHLETWFVFTGGYEAGHTGMHQFLHENRLDPERTSFIVIDAVGAGYLRYTRAEGLIVPRNAASNLIRIARETARDNPVWNLRPVSLRSVPTDLYSISAKGYQGISLFAAAGDGYPPHWHRPEDTAENVHQETLEIASQAVLTMIRRLDEQANPEPEAPSAPN